MASSIPLVFCIDAEPDDFTPDPEAPAPWLGYGATARLSAEWRVSFEDATGSRVHFSWFVRSDPQIEHIYGSTTWPFERYRELLDAAIGAGDHVGLHVHFSRWSEEGGYWLEDFESEPWTEECVRSGVAAFEAALDRPCESVRIGNHFMSQAVSNVLEELGVRYDLTPEPGARARDILSPRHHMKGTLPDYGTMLQDPHRRSRHSFLEPDDNRSDGLFVLPVSAALIDAGSPPAAQAASDDGAYLRLGLWYPNEAFRYVLETCLRKVSPPCLVLVMRTDMPLDPGFAGRIRENLASLLGHPLRRRFVVSSPADAMATVLLDRDRPTHVAPRLGESARRPRQA